MAAASDDVRRVHERLDDISRDIGEIKGDLAEMKATCKPCYKQVMGNGTPPLSERINEQSVRIVRLEEARSVSKTWLTIMAGVSGGVAALLVWLLNYVSQR